MSMDDFIPPGFAPLANWDSRNRRNNDGHSVEWKTLRDAVKDGEIPGFKLSNGRWYVHQRRATEFLAKVDLTTPIAAKAISEIAGLHVTLASHQFDSAFDCFNAAAGALERIEKLLERMTLAVESLATQPTRQRDPVEEFANDSGFQN